MSKGRDAILRWCQRNSYGYDGVEVDNFDSSFANGLAFCALLDSQRPDLLKESGLEWNDLVNDFSRNERLEWAFGKADEIGIPRLLDPEDVDETKPDPKVVITYLSGMIRFFQEEDGDSAESSIERPTGSFAASIDDLIGGGSGKKKGDQTPPPSSATSATAKKVPALKSGTDSPTASSGAKKEVPVEVQLEKLEKMFQNGLLNQEAYEKSKQKIMDKMREQQQGGPLSARSDHSSNSESSSTNSSSTQQQSGAGGDEKTQKALANLQKLYEKGTLSEEEYKKAVEKLKAKSETKPSAETSSSSIDTSKFSPEQLKQYEKLTKMLQSGLLGEAEYQKSLNNLLDKVSKSQQQTEPSSPVTPVSAKQPSTSSQQESTSSASASLIDKIQDTKKLNNLKTLLNKGVITEDEFEKSISKLYQQEQEKKNAPPSTPPPTTTTATSTASSTSDISADLDNIKDEDLDEKTRGRVKAIDRMYNAGLFKEHEYAHARRKAIAQGLQEAGGKFTSSPSTATPTVTSTPTKVEPKPTTTTATPPVVVAKEEDKSGGAGQRKRTASVFIQQPNLPKEINADVDDYRLLYEKLLKEHEELAADYDEIQEEHEELKEQLSTIYNEKKQEFEVPEELKPVLKKVVAKKKQLGKMEIVIIYSSDDSLVTEKVTLK